jgi:positive regulator of sigma E activity
VKSILCRRLWEFATTLLETWTSMHLECGKRKKMNEKQVWTIVFLHYIYCVFFLFLPRFVTSFLMFWMTLECCVLCLGTFFSTY